MPEIPLLVFARNAAPPLLGALQEALHIEEFPAEFGVGVAGPATEEELNSMDWDLALLRWQVPELHEVALLERLERGRDEEADEIIAEKLMVIARSDDTAGRLIATEYLSGTRSIYTIEILPALLEDDDHAAWGALDILLRYIAQVSDGIIYIAAEGFCDEDGELLLAEADAR